MYKKTLLSLAIITLLSGCGSSDDSGNTSNGETNEKTTEHLIFNTKGVTGFAFDGFQKLYGGNSCNDLLAISEEQSYKALTSKGRGACDITEMTSTRGHLILRGRFMNILEQDEKEPKNCSVIAVPLGKSEAKAACLDESFTKDLLKKSKYSQLTKGKLSSDGNTVMFVTGVGSYTKARPLVGISMWKDDLKYNYKTKVVLQDPDGIVDNKEIRNDPEKVRDIDQVFNIGNSYSATMGGKFLHGALGNNVEPESTDLATSYILPISDANSNETKVLFQNEDSYGSFDMGGTEIITMRNNPLSNCLLPVFSIDKRVGDLSQSPSLFSLYNKSVYWLGKYNTVCQYNYIRGFVQSGHAKIIIREPFGNGIFKAINENGVYKLSMDYDKRPLSEQAIEMLEQFFEEFNELTKMNSVSISRFATYNKGIVVERTTTQGIKLVSYINTSSFPAIVIDEDVQDKPKYTGFISVVIDENVVDDEGKEEEAESGVENENVDIEPNVETEAKKEE